MIRAILSMDKYVNSSEQSIKWPRMAADPGACAINHLLVNFSKTWNERTTNVMDAGAFRVHCFSQAAAAFWTSCEAREIRALEESEFAPRSSLRKSAVSSSTTSTVAVRAGHV
jgi:hypothetical protein